MEWPCFLLIAHWRSIGYDRVTSTNAQTRCLQTLVKLLSMITAPFLRFNTRLSSANETNIWHLAPFGTLKDQNQILQSVRL